jgi:hypothetical protein
MLTGLDSYLAQFNILYCFVLHNIIMQLSDNFKWVYNNCTRYVYMGKIHISFLKVDTGLFLIVCSK